MTLSRRKFLKAGILTSIVAGTTTNLTAPAVGRPRAGRPDSLSVASSLDYYNKATFQSYINSEFRIYSNGRSETWVRLVLVEDFPASEATAPDECFRLLFSAAAETSLPQGTYYVDHAALGTFPLFVVPHDVDGQRQYEAVFNRRFSEDVRPKAAPNPAAKGPAKKR